MQHDYYGYEICPHCGKEFAWKYIDDGYRSNMTGLQVTVTSHVIDKSIALCSLIYDGYPYLIGRCTHCHAVVEFQCNEDILKGLSS